MLTPPDSDSDDIEELKTITAHETMLAAAQPANLQSDSSAFDTMMFNQDDPKRLYNGEEQDSQESFNFEQQRAVLMKTGVTSNFTFQPKPVIKQVTMAKQNNPQKIKA